MTAPKPRFTGTFSFGNMVQIGAMLVMVVGLYFTLDSRSALNTQAIEEMQQDVREMREELHALETDSVRYDERISGIYLGMGRIEGQLDQIKQALNLR